MMDVVVTQPVNAGMEEAFEAIVRQVTANTLSRDEGCLRYEWYRAEAPQTYILIERWTDQAAARLISRPITSPRSCRELWNAFQKSFRL